MSKQMSIELNLLYLDETNITIEEETLYFLLLIELYIDKKGYIWNKFELEYLRENAAEIAEENYNLHYGINKKRK